ncbi:hypothetical protein EYF80_040783 [Liparis tanakae]|uniref:Uncharacterized protein n=1 Tax=Liparis tanakae TaxID=230148 RepID=A0A4Z2G6Z5_9TELE|nr:hypothetical protein EYF80_040783 [Liparis tanakae]
MAVEKPCFRMTSSALRSTRKTRRWVPSARKTSAASDSGGRDAGCVYLVRVQLPSHHRAAGEHVHPHVDVGVAALEPAVVLHPLQALLRPVVVATARYDSSSFRKDSHAAAPSVHSVMKVPEEASQREILQMETGGPN